MAAANLVVKMLLDSNGFDKNIKTAKASIEGFEKIGKNVLGTLGKFAGAIGLATTASAAFEKVIRGSQATSDAFDRVMRVGKTSVDAFFTSISTGDFSAFNQGLNTMIEKAKDAATALDQLGNTTMSFGYFSTKYGAEFQEAMAKVRDKTLSPKEIKEAMKVAEAAIEKQREITTSHNKTVDEAMRSLVTETNGLSKDDVNRIDVEEIFYLDVSAHKDELKSKLDAEYKEYQKIYDDVVKKHTTYKQTGNSIAGPVFTPSTDYAAVKEEMKVYNQRYRAAVLYNEILKEWGDNGLQYLMNIMSQSDNATRNLASMEKTYVRVKNMELSNGKTTKEAPAVEKQPLYGSIKWFETEIDKLTKEANSIDLSVDKAKYDDTMAKIKKLQLERDALLKVGTVEIPDLSDTSWMEDMEFDTKQVKVIDETNDALTVYQTNINNVANSLTNLSSVMSNNAGSWLQWASNVLNALASALPSIVGTSSANEILKKSMKALSKETATYGMAQMNAATATYNVAAANVAEAASIELLKKVKEEDTNATVKNTVANEAAENSNMSLVNSIRELIPAKTAEAAASAGAETAKAGPLGWLATAGAIATIIAAFASIPKFADGGIVSSPFTSGDKVLARVNGGEMILNKHQQSNLFNLLDGGATTSGSRQVEFKISGKELVGVLNNYNNKMSKLR